MEYIIIRTSVKVQCAMNKNVSALFTLCLFTCVDTRRIFTRHTTVTLVFFFFSFFFFFFFSYRYQTICYGSLMTINIPIKVQKNSFSVERFSSSLLLVILVPFFFFFPFREIYILSCAFTCNTATCFITCTWSSDYSLQ